MPACRVPQSQCLCPLCVLLIPLCYIFGAGRRFLLTMLFPHVAGQAGMGDGRHMSYSQYSQDSSQYPQGSSLYISNSHDPESSMQLK